MSMSGLSPPCRFVRCTIAPFSSAALAEETGLGHDRIILSAKVSGVQDLIAVYRALAARCDYPLHLGLTEAGMGMKGIVASTAGLAPLLLDVHVEGQAAATSLGVQRGRNVDLAGERLGEAGFVHDVSVEAVTASRQVA